MPELPEVETVCSGLQLQLPGRTVVSAAVGKKALRRTWPEQFCRRLTGSCFHTIRRRAKYLLFDLTAPDGKRHTLLWHLGMSGCLRLLSGDDPTPGHQHVRLGLDDGRVLSYSDPRRFGLVDLIDGDEWEQHPLLCKLGPEPLEAGFHADYLYRSISHRRSAIKALLLNSHIVVGIGNIYACEALLDAGISPLRLGSSLEIGECQRLVAAIRSVLQRAIAAGGSTIRDFAGSDGKPGYFAHQFHCYGRENLPCPCCRNPIVRIVQQGRSSFYCPVCQPCD